MIHAYSHNDTITGDALVNLSEEDFGGLRAILSAMKAIGGGGEGEGGGGRERKITKVVRMVRMVRVVIVMRAMGEW